jgi:chromosomal replication initiator protein
MNIVIANMNMDRNVVLDIPQVRRWLHDLIDEDQKDNVTADSIRKAVCEFFKVNIDDLNKDTRIQSIVVPRQIAMYLCRVLLKNSSLPSIAKTFDRTHANIYFACTKMKKLYRSDETTRGNIHEILGLLGKTDADLDIEETGA